MSWAAIVSLQGLSEQLLDQEDEVESLRKEVELMASVTAPQALEELTNQSKNLKDDLTATHKLISKKKEQGERSSFVQSIKGRSREGQQSKPTIVYKSDLLHISSFQFLLDEFQMFEDWLQDEQLAVNECFENPETREDVEASMLKLKVSS